MSAAAIASEIGALAPRRRRRTPPSAYLAVAACVAVMAIMAAPLVFSFFASIETPTEASSAPHYLPQTFSLQNYLKVAGYQGDVPRNVENGGAALLALSR
jgi:multiple sugar transport system permease protein